MTVSELERERRAREKAVTKLKTDTRLGRVFFYTESFLVEPSGSSKHSTKPFFFFLVSTISKRFAVSYCCYNLCSRIVCHVGITIFCARVRVLSRVVIVRTLLRKTVAVRVSSYLMALAVEIWTFDDDPLLITTISVRKVLRICV